ncbi:MAG: ribonuclease HII [Alphaproteobacteria bacterium]|nr:ribonuclease HII [Alphaproteobacteria bacterium]
MPSLTFERSCGAMPVCGIDEAGRGPLAGPVVAAAVVLDLAKPLPRGINDSKQLDRPTRERLADKLRARALIGVGAATVEEIDRINILQATMLAMRRAVDALAAVLGRPPAHALVDGNRAPTLPCPVQTIVDGDALCLSIAAASIIAKVTRDRMMCELAALHPHYGWERNAGYGTPEHLAALEQHGPTPHHRTSFRPVEQLRLNLAGGFED